ncbi:MAG TPA: radical SAM protein [Patescibacteria group bacterium]|nr:radical SAM protein [Patescibacteria group bacterium]
MSKPRVILFFPNTGFDIKGVSVDLPLAVLNLAAFLVQDFEVQLIDQRVEPDWRTRLSDELKQRPLAIGISAMTCPQILYGLEACILANQISPQTKRVWGGIHPTLMPQSTLRNALVDVVVRDRGELAFRDLLLGWRDNPQADLKNFSSLSFVADNTYCETPLLKEPRGRLNAFPPIPYHLLRAGVETYIGSQGRFANPDQRALIMIGSSGCPQRCTYCAMPGMGSTRTQDAEDPERTVARVKELVATYGINAVAFHDEEFAINPRRAIRVAELLLKEIGGRSAGFRWWCQTRMDTLARLADFQGKNYLPLFIDSGLESVQPGIESGSNRILSMIRKRETVEDFLQVNRILAKHPDLSPLYNFMVGFPTETVDEMKATLRLAVQLIDENPAAMVAGVYVLVPYPGTEMFETAKEAGFQPPQTLEEWAQFNRQQLLTPWVASNPEILELAEFARLTSRFIDGTRLPRRLNQALGGKSGLSEKDFAGLSELVRSRWRSGTVSEVPVFRAVNQMVLSLFNVGRELKLSGALAGTGPDERTKEFVLDTSIRLGGNEVKTQDTEYRTTQQFFDRYGELPQRTLVNAQNQNKLIALVNHKKPESP